MSVDQKSANLRNTSQPKSNSEPKALPRLASYTWNLFRGLDQESACTVEHSLLFCIIALLIWALAPFCWLGRLETCSSILVPTRGSITTEWSSESPAHVQKHYHILDLADRWKFSEESIRQLVKDEPGVVKIKRGPKAAHATYRIPVSVAIDIYVRLGGEASTFDEEHYRIVDIASRWGLGRETVRQLIKDEPGVLKLGLGRKHAHLSYSVPESVMERVHNRLLYVV